MPDRIEIDLMTCVGFAAISLYDAVTGERVLGR